MFLLLECDYFTVQKIIYEPCNNVGMGHNFLILTFFIFKYSFYYLKKGSSWCSYIPGGPAGAVERHSTMGREEEEQNTAIAAGFRVAVHRSAFYSLLI